MTRDEILNMSAGREMDALIGEKVMGWKLWVDENHSKLSGAMMVGDKFLWHIRENVFSAEETWSPSSDIATAWEVTEKFYSACVERLSNGEWTASFHYSVGKANAYEFASAETAPLAICRAALLAVMKGWI